MLPWHTDRLRIIDLGAALARTAAALGKIARDVTLLAQSEVGEVSEGVAAPNGGGHRAWWQSGCGTAPWRLLRDAE